MELTVTGYRASSPAEYYFWSTDEMSLPIEVDIVENDVVIKAPTGRLQSVLLVRDQAGYWNPPPYFYLKISDTEELMLVNALLQGMTLDNIPEESTDPIVCHLEKTWVITGDFEKHVHYAEWRDEQCRKNIS